MNIFGRFFRISTFGESHGSGIGCVVDGCPSGLKLTREYIQAELDRRMPGRSSIASDRKERDEVEILSGVFEGKTLGTPISMFIGNVDVDSSKYEELRNIPRPGHGDYTWKMKFGWVDWRGGGRSSGRETVGRVAGGAVARKLLQSFGVEVIAYSKEIAGIRGGDIEIRDVVKSRKVVDSNPVKTLDLEKAGGMEEAVLAAKKEGDSVGGVIEAVVFGVPPGLGEPVFGRLDADLASALMSIPSVKGVEFGGGFRLAGLRGSEVNDSFTIEDGRIVTETNNCGGILGGISDGMPIVVKVAVKPTSSIGRRQKTVDLKGMKQTSVEIRGRHDPCIVPRAVPVVEAMVSLVLADHSMVSGFIPRKLV